MEKVEKKLWLGKYTWIILLCWLVYTCSYIGKVNYSANINQVMAHYGVSHADAGMVSTFFFFAYGIGQVINGLFCKKYNIKYMVAGALVISGTLNLIVAISDYFAIVKYLWLCNGLALSVLWPTLIRFLSETVSRKEMPTASVTMGTTVAAGTLIIYGLSALYARIDFKLSFYTAAVVLPAVAIVWLISCDRIRAQAIAMTAEEEGETPVVSESQPQSKEEKKASQKLSGDLLVTVLLLAVFAVGVNLISDGLTTWVPSILKENYGLDDSLSIILTLALPLLTIFSNLFAVVLNKKIPDFVSACTFLFACSGGLIALIIGTFSLDLVVVTIISFALVRALVGGANSTITSIFPLFMKGKVNSGLIAGVLNGCCYVGSTISSYGLGLIVDNFGWNAVFWLLFAVCAFVCTAWCVYILCKTVKSKKSKKETDA